MTTIGMRKAHLSNQTPIEGCIDINCPKCGHAMTADPITARELNVLCLPCAAEQGYAAARALYKNCYGRDWDPKRKDDAPDHARTTSFIGPKCSHLERVWTPVITVYVNGRKLGRHWIPGFYCEACSHQITVKSFRDAIANRLGGSHAPAERPGETWQLFWARQDDVRQLFYGRSGSLNEMLSADVEKIHTGDFTIRRNG